MYKLKIKMSYMDRVFQYEGGELEEMNMVIKSLAEHELFEADEPRTKFMIEYEPDKTVTIAEGANGEEIDRPGWHNLSDE